MWKPYCNRAGLLLLAAESGPLGSAEALWLEDHLSRCTVCRADARDLSLLLGAWREQPLPGDRGIHRQRLEAALSNAPVVVPQDSFSTPPGWSATSLTHPLDLWRARPLAISLGAVAVMALVVAGALGASTLLRGDTPVSRGAVQEPGPAHAFPGLDLVETASSGMPSMSRGRVPWDTELTAPPGPPMRLRLGKRGPRFGFEPATRARFRSLPGELRVDLRQGALSVDAPPGSGWRYTVGLGAQASVEVVGTRFWVARDENGRVEVAVARGRVRYLHAGTGGSRVITLAARDRLVHARGGPPAVSQASGDPWAALLDGSRSSPSPRHADAPGALAGTLVPDRPSAPPLAQRPDLDCRLSTLRSLRDKGPVAALLARLDRCRRTGRAGRELRVLEAETLLRAGQVAQAAHRFEEIARLYRGTLAAQNATLSAAHLWRHRLGQRARAERLCRQYLREYPHGLHRSEVEALLR